MQVQQFEQLEQNLTRAHSALGASESHGVLSGLICMSRTVNEAQWLEQVFDEPAPAGHAAEECRRELCALGEAILAEMDAGDFSFQLLLPDDEEPLADRTEALGEWCQGFLAGLGLGGYREELQISEEAREVVNDLSEISRAEFEFAENNQEDEQDLAEVIEYVRMGALLLYEELGPHAAARQLH